MTTYRFGNAHGANLTVASGDITNNVITFGNGNGDYVLAEGGNISQDTITFGQGHDDRVLSPFGNISGDVIVFGNNSSDATVRAGSLSKAGEISDDTIIFGDGSHNRVVDSQGGGRISNDKIVFGTGSSNSVDASSIVGTDITFNDDKGVGSNSVVARDSISNNSKIDFGGGNNDNFDADTVSNSIINFGDGNNDSLHGPSIAPLFGQKILSNDTIQFGNGNGDSVYAYSSGGNNTIILGNGNNDVIALNIRAGLGGDYLATGIGSGDAIVASNHTNADTFAFATFSSSLHFFGTSSLTKVYGAQSNDKIEVNGGNLGDALVSKGMLPTGTTLSSFINTVVGDPTKGHTYIGNNGTTTFIETDTQSGQLGAIEIVGTFAHSTISNHVLTLHV
jgi:hypothetical protein